MKTKRFMIPPGRRVDLKDFDPSDTCGYKDKNDAAGKLRSDIERLRTQQDLLYANKSYALLIILEGMDSAGKDGVIKHVMSGLNPQGVDVHPFGKPSEEELNHDFMWRCVKALPERGRIGIFNRSYYDAVIVTRVKPELLRGEHISPSDVNEKFWQRRHQATSNFEKYLTRNATIVMKLFLHISKAEQRRRLLKRAEMPNKHWKFSPNDLDSHKRWTQYQRAFAQTFSETSSREAPWYVIPANHKWAARVVVADIIADKMSSLKLRYPKPDPEQWRAIQEALVYLKKETA